MTEQAEPMLTTEREAAIRQALRGIAESGLTAAQVTANLQANMPMLRVILGGATLEWARQQEPPRNDYPAGG